jgi:hypothetical protein
MPANIPRCLWTPWSDQQVICTIDGQERLRWHYGPQYPRPFFFPLVGPSGQPLTRMGHPGAPNHDHHRSIWFAHNKVLGIDFWGDRLPASIRQQDWLAYIDGDEEAILAVQLGWYDGHDPQPLLTQQLIAAVRPGPNRETLLELQTTFTPQADMLEFGQTNFGFLAVRVAKSLSAHFGGGQLVDSDYRVGEPAIFGQRAKWMDYSGPIAAGVTEGITYFDHPTNPGHPTHWHVREDGWMGASVCFAEAHTITRTEPLTLRYLLHAHNGSADADRAQRTFAEFAAHPPLVLKKATAKHETYTVVRAG